jgi:hypothetical protein
MAIAEAKRRRKRAIRWRNVCRVSWGKGWVVAPDSWAIASALNAAGAEVCRHGRAPCYVRCGVERSTWARDGVRLPPREAFWRPIPEEERAAWYARLIARRAETVGHLLAGLNVYGKKGLTVRGDAAKEGEGR